MDRFVPPNKGEGVAVVRVIPGNFSTPFVPEGFDPILKKGEGVVVAPNGVIELPTVDLEYFCFRQHFNSRNNRFFTCSAGPLYKFPDLRNPCLGCDAVDADRKSHIGAQDRYAFLVVWMKRHHLLPLLDDKGRVVKSKQDKEIYKWQPCGGRSCDECAGNKPIGNLLDLLPKGREAVSSSHSVINLLNANVKLARLLQAWDVEALTEEANKLLVPTREFHVYDWNITLSQVNALYAHDKVVRQDCANCGAQTSMGEDPVIDWAAYGCPNCGTVVFDRENTSYDVRDIERMVADPMPCPECRNIVVLEETIMCQNCGPEGVRVSIYDVDLEVSQVELPPAKGMKSGKKDLQFGRNSKPYALSEEITSFVGKMKLDQIHMATSVEEQRQLV